MMAISLDDGESEHCYDVAWVAGRNQVVSESLRKNEFGLSLEWRIDYLRKIYFAVSCYVNEENGNLNLGFLIRYDVAVPSATSQSCPLWKKEEITTIAMVDYRGVC